MAKIQWAVLRKKKLILDFTEKEEMLLKSMFFRRKQDVKKTHKIAYD